MRVKSRQEFFLNVAEIQIKVLSHLEIENIIEEFNCNKGDALASLALALQEKYSGITNGFLSDVHSLLFGEVVEFEGEVDDLYNCPCCGYKTLNELYNSELGTGYDICVVCHWEDDGTTDINEYSGVNKGSINDYREKMKANPNYFYREKYKNKTWSAELSDE